MKTKSIPPAFRLFLVIGVFSFAIHACAEPIDDSSCESLVSKNSWTDVNTTLSLSVPPHINSFELTEDVNFVVENRSNTIIEIAADQDIKAFWWKGSSWSPIKNEVDYLSKVDWLSPKTTDDPGITIYSVVLDIPEPPDRVRVCIILKGLKDPNGDRDAVAAYTEVVLNP